MRVSVCLGAILIPEYLDFHSGYSAPRMGIAGIYCGIYSHSGVSQTNAAWVIGWPSIETNHCIKNTQPRSEGLSLACPGNEVEQYLYKQKFLPL